MLIDRLWPRGVSKQEARLDEWARELAPSSELRRWFGHEPAKFDEFRRRYRAELSGHEEKLRELRRRGRGGTVTLVYSARDTEHKLGIWAGSTGELFFEDVEVPAENLIGEEGQGFEIAMYGLDQGRFTVAAGACGVVRACLERSVEYARERETFGQAIGRYQLVQDMIAKMVLGYETSKLLVMQAAWMKNQGRRNTRETSLAKWHATESAFEASHLAIQVFGSYGYSAEYGIERYFRNARAPIIYEGTTQIHKMLQAEDALGYRDLNGRGGHRSPVIAWSPAPAGEAG